MASKRPVTPRSRFAEGSMSDRASAAPPPHFLGPDTRCQSSASLPTFPARSSSSTASHCDSEAQPPPRPRSASISEKKGLSGLWEGLREKIWGKKRPASFDGGAVSRPEVAGENRPTREEMLASYQELMAAGFFQARAIQGTRQPPPGSRPPSRGEFGQAYVRPRLETIYSPRHARPEADVTLPIQGTPDPSADPTTPDSRGKKRAHDDGEEEDQGKTEEKTVRKLRKTTRSITELHSRLRRAREETHPPVSYRPGGSVRARRSVSGSGPNRLTKRPVRPSSSSGDTRATISAPVTAPVRLVPGAFDAMRGLEDGSVRLRRKPADDSLREWVDGGSAPAQAPNWVSEEPAQSSNWISCEGADPDDAPNENWVSADKVPRAHAGQRRARSPRKMPLSIVPDANRGIPSVPAIPAQFKASDGENAAFVPGRFGQGAIHP